MGKKYAETNFVDPISDTQKVGRLKNGRKQGNASKESGNGDTCPPNAEGDGDVKGGSKRTVASDTHHKFNVDSDQAPPGRSKLQSKRDSKKNAKDDRKKT